jgi:hypothetical protein
VSCAPIIHFSLFVFHSPCFSFLVFHFLRSRSSKGLQLVFLNGCSTQQQTQALLDANISAVISTSRSIDDKVATDFSCRFYQGLAGGASVRAAYNEAGAAVQTAGSGNTRAARARGGNLFYPVYSWCEIVILYE